MQAQPYARTYGLIIRADPQIHSVLSTVPGRGPGLQVRTQA